jgi:type I restriction enzyme S subunit
MKLENWKNIPIKSVYLGFWDGPHATPKKSKHGPVYLGIKNITEDGRLDLSDIRHIAEEDFPKWTRRVQPQPGDIVFTYEATLHRYALIPEGFRGCLGRRVALIRPDSSKVDPRFLHYYFFGDKWQKEVEKHKILGATVDRIPLIEFPDFKIHLPPLPIQRKIAAVLSAYDDLIGNNTRRIEILEAIARAIYREWFVEFRFPGHEDVGMVDSSKEQKAGSISPISGPIPYGWQIKSLKDFCHLTLGVSPKSKFYNEEGDGLPFHQGVSDFGDIYPTTRRYCTVTKRVAEDGDILFSVRAPVGRINLADRKIVIGRGLHAIRSKTGHQMFVLHQLKDKFEGQEDVGSGTIFKSVTKSDMLGIQLLVPPEDILDGFEEIVIPLFKQIEVLTRKNAILRRTRDLLLPKLVSGEVRLQDLDIEVRELT